MENALVINALSKKYPSFELKNVSFAVRRGEVMGFVGRNGAGKTTTLKSILNLVHPDSGTVEILGMDFSDSEDRIKQQTGYAVGGIGCYRRKKLRDLIAVTSMFYENWDNDECRHYMNAFRLDGNKRMIDLSEGMKVKFYLTMALSHHAELLILDEPTSGLDPVSRDELCAIFTKLSAKGVAILFSTHITSDLDKCADSITYIKDGSILASQKKDAFIRSYEKELGKIPTLEEIMVHIEKEEVEL